jgi:hypothetical protein
MRQPVGVSKPELAEVREIQRLVGKSRRDVAERVGALITKTHGIRRGSNAEGIKNEKNDAAFGQV